MEIEAKNFKKGYDLSVLHQIKQIFKESITMDPNKEKEIDQKMLNVLSDLNISLTVYSESSDLRERLTGYYAALYFDNVSLWQTILAKGIPISTKNVFEEDYYCLLDKRLVSGFETEEYLELIEKIPKVLVNFYYSIIDLAEEEQEQYIERFVRLLKARKKDILAVKDFEKIADMFTKKSMDCLYDETYLKMNPVQALGVPSKPIENEQNIERLNYLIQTTDFSTHFSDLELMFDLYNDEELLNISWEVGEYFYKALKSGYLERAKELYSISPIAVRLFKFDQEIMDALDNRTIIELLEENDNIFTGYYSNTQIIKTARQTRGKRLIKRLFK